MSDEFVDAEIEQGGQPHPIVYLRQVGDGAVTAEGEEIPAEAYAIHDENGRPIAVFPDRETAIIAARVNDMEPVSVH